MLEHKREKQVNQLIKKALTGNRASQKELYRQFYGYGMAICIRYTQNKEEAQEVLNDSFIKAFKNLDRFDFEKPFKYWLRRIVINTSIDHLRKNKKYRETLNLEQAHEVSEKVDGLNNLSAQEILNLVQKLAPSYRLVFNLYVIEGYTHREIAEELGISTGTSKSNLSMARTRLKKMYLEMKGINHYVL
ncbi:MAG: RNA polymerase sigma factor [Saprospiraceae bacterium]